MSVVFLTQSLCLLIMRSMSSFILRYLSSDSGLWPAESSASMSGLSQPLRPFLRSVWRHKERTGREREKERERERENKRQKEWKKEIIEPERRKEITKKAKTTERERKGIRSKKERNSELEKVFGLIV